MNWRSLSTSPAHIPTGESALSIILQARGRYEHYKFGSRHMLAKLKAKKESTAASEPTMPSSPQPATVSEPVPVPDLRDLITPKKSNLRATITSRKTPAAPRKAYRPNRGRSYSGLKMGETDMDIRERKKTDAARKREREAEQVLAEAKALREAAEENEARVVDRQISDLVSYKDALVSNSSQPQGSQYTLHSRKRGRSRTPSSSPS